MTDNDRTNGVLTIDRPDRAEVDTLIRRASDHPLGTRFLTEGALDAVAATFNVHAFVVDAAREVLGAPAGMTEPKPQLIAARTAT
jgi:hypothetical protein